MEELAWYWLVAIYLVGFVVTVFLFNLLMYDEYGRDDANFWMVPCSLAWPAVLPVVGAYYFFYTLYTAPAKLAKHCRKVISKWGE